MSLITCPRCLGAKNLCRGCSQFAIDAPELFGSCGSDVPCPMCNGEGEVTPEVADTLHPRIKRLRERDKYTAELTAGWGTPGDARSPHYFPAGDVFSLCRKWMFSGQRMAEWKWPDDHARNCAVCRRKKAKKAKA